MRYHLMRDEAALSNAHRQIHLVARASHCAQASRCTVDAVPPKSAARSPTLACAVSRLKAFQPLLYGYEPLSTGKLLSNMQRLAPNASMHVCIHGFQVSASSTEDGGRSPFSKSKPLIRIPMPPTLT